MRRKFNYLIFIIILTLFLWACDNKSTPSISKEDISKVKDTDYDTVVKNLTDNIKQYMKEHTYYNIANINFAEDSLAIDQKNEVKKFNNIDLSLEVEFDFENSPIDTKDGMSSGEKRKLFEEFTKRSTEELMDVLLKENPIEFARLNKMDILYKDDLNKFKNQEDISMLRDDKTMKELNVYSFKSEGSVLKSIFSLINKDKKVYELKRFGIDENFVLIEFSLYSKDKTDEEIKKIGDNLYNLILETNDYYNDIKDKNIDSVKIIFNKEYESNEAFVFEYKLD